MEGELIGRFGNRSVTIDASRMQYGEGQRV